MKVSKVLKIGLLVFSLTVAGFVLFSLASIITARTDIVETCATYNGDLPQLEDTDPKCKSVRVKRFPKFICEIIRGEPVYDETPGLGPFMVYDSYDSSKYEGCRDEAPAP